MDKQKKKDLKALTLSELTTEIERLSEPGYRAKQLYEWMHIRHARSLMEMSNLPKSLRQRLSEEYHYTALTVEKCLSSKQDGTKKYLLGLSDGNRIEAVFMRYRYGNSVCISSQAGCRMGCRFCASAQGGLSRSLTTAEMLDEVYALSADTGEKISHIVVMGTGEPFDNFEAVKSFLLRISDEDGLHVSRRNLTVSTCGLVPGILQLANEALPVTLALSLHAVSDEKRKRLMPVAERYSIAELMSACSYYYEKTGRRVSLEYALIAGENDGSEDAEALSYLARKHGFHVNLIPVNPIAGRTYQRPARAASEAFKNKLEKYGVNVTIRRTLGEDIAGACGQLRSGAV